MDYEKEYKAALERCREFYAKLGNKQLKEEVEDIFPELAEPDDERIRKQLLEMVHDFTGDSLWVDYNIHKEDAIAWLEKQGEQKFEQKFFINDKVVHKATGKIWTIHHYLKDTNSYYVEDNDGLLHHYGESELKLVDQKPACSEEEVEIIDWLIASFDCLKIPTDTFYQSKVRPFLISLRNKIQPIIKEWSEEDERIKNNLSSELTNLSVRKLIEKETEKKYASWLKSLKDRYTWKPSEEEMKALEFCLEHNIDKDGVFGSKVVKLYNELKKLREEDV